MTNENQFFTSTSKINNNINNNSIEFHPWVILAQNLAHIMMDRSDLHGIGHVRRVINHLKLILIKLNSRFDFNSDNTKEIDYNPMVLYVAAWLHDLGRNYKTNYLNIQDYPSQPVNHAHISALIAREFLTKNININSLKTPANQNLKIKSGDVSIRDFEVKYKRIRPMDEPILQKIITCIKEHSFSAGLKPSTLESKILSDADKLDALGAIGIYRTASYQNEEGTGINGMIRHFHEKLLKLDDKLILNESKTIAAKRIEFMNKYLEELNSEMRYELENEF